MTPTQAITLATEALLLVTFAGALVNYARRRDAFGRDLALVFGAFVPAVVADVLNRTIGPVPLPVSYVLIVLLLAQPVFLLRLVGRLRDLPRALGPAVVASFVATTGLLLTTVLGAPTWVALPAIILFIGLEAVAAVFLAAEARRRQGASRVRMILAALATGGFALGFIAASAGSALGEARPVGQLLLLLAAAGYVVAFLPPGRLRRLWSATTALSFGEELRGVSPTEPAGELWRRLATTASRITGAETVVLEGEHDGSSRVVASTVAAVQVGRHSPPGELQSMLGPAEGTPTARIHVPADLMSASGTKVATVVPISVDRSRPAAIVLLSRHASLFGNDDVALLGTIGSQTALLVERRAVLADQEALAERLAGTVDALRAASQAKSDFLASMSHELRTPLNAIIGFSQLIREEPEADGMKPAPGEWIEHIHRGGQHLLALINDVLDLSKVEAGRLEFTPEPVDLGQAVSELVAGLRPLADRKQISLTHVVEPMVIDIDRGRLRQILYNLLSNAIKYTGENGDVTLAVSGTLSEVRLTVADNGVGIAPSDQPRVYEEFTQVGAAAGRQEGTGLGLALTRRLVEAQGGRIELESELGVGSRFTVVLPRRASVMTPPTTEPMRPRLGSDAYVLVVEDDPGAVRLLRAYLEGEGISMRVAGDAESALAVARRSPPSAIVLDVLLPGTDGWDLLRAFKADDDLRDIPVIIVTVVDEREVGIALGAVDYFLKPVSRDALMARLSRYTFTTKVRTRPVHILAIDDEPAALDLIEGVLAPEGFIVSRAESGAAGLALARSQKPDLVICDLVMPGLDGFGVISQLKADNRTRDVPILVLTAHQLTDVEKTILNGQILGVVGKGDDAVVGLRDWLTRVAPGAGPVSVTPA